MEEFANSVHSITARFQRTEALRRQKPFRNFKDVLTQFPKFCELWFAFEQQKLKAAAIALIEDLDWKILEEVDDRPEVDFSEPQDASYTLQSPKRKASGSCGELGRLLIRAAELNSLCYSRAQRIKTS